MSQAPKPALRPARPNFSSGPCVKPPAWSLDELSNACLGRYHRSRAGRTKIREALDRTRAVLRLPEGYVAAILPGSDTGAFEAAMWNLLGARGVDVLSWESFGAGWAKDVVSQLKIKDARLLDAPYGATPDFGAVDFSRDVVFAWNGTTSGVRVPGGDWIPHDREGLTLCDATSAVFAMPIDWSKVDVATFSWQKSLGGEAGFGVLILGPRALERLAAYAPAWPIPKLFRIQKDGGFDSSLGEDGAINTPSLLLIEDYLFALRWAASIGGVPGLAARCAANAKVMWDWIEASGWAQNLCADPALRSPTSVCFTVGASGGGDETAARAQAKAIADSLEREGAAFDILGYRAAPPGLRIWCGPTVEAGDLDALTPWLDWAYAQSTAKV